jgi:hypothetical protein
MSVESVLAHLEGVRSNGSQWMALCPAHADKNPSLAVREGDEKILLHCFAGCPLDSILGAAGISPADLSLNSTRSRKIAATYDYMDELGALLFQVLRYEPKSFKQRAPDGRGGWAWNLNGARRVLYRLPEIIGASKVLVVEGEKDVETARARGFVATCNPGGAGKWRGEYSEFLRGKDVVIVPDQDEPGRKHADQVARALHLIARRVRIFALPEPLKDLSEWPAELSTEALQELIDQAPEAMPTAAIEEPAQQERPQATLPTFPEEAWRGIFNDYRKANERATEASDVFHFAALWARCAGALGRRVHFSYGMKLYPNVYIVCFGPTGDRKTTATRQAAELGNGLKVISGGGSGEGLADEVSRVAHGEGVLIHTEELSQILKPGRWEGSTLIPFLTQCFDCPEHYEMKFRKSPVSLERPTPNLLAGTTPEWFWRDFRANDFQGGFGNRIFFLAGGSPKACLPRPESPSLGPIVGGVENLLAVDPCEARLEAEAARLWDKFYREWRGAEMKDDSLLHVAVKRVPSYVLKLAMLYAAGEGTLPEIRADQLSAAILVGQYGAECASELLSLQHAGTSPRKELERRILALLRAENSTTKREIYKRLWRHYKDAEEFNRAFDSLQRAGEIFTSTSVGGRGSVRVSLEPL